MLANRRIAFIGGGHITEIILSNLIERQLIPPKQLIVSSRGQTRLHHLKKHFAITVASDNTSAAQQGDLILINVRPGVVKTILPNLQAAQLRSDQVVVSLAAGIPMSQYNCLGKQQPLVRALPNPPSQIGQGIAALVFSSQVTPKQRQLTRTLFDSLGNVLEVEETYLNAITALSSPVATYMFCQALIDAGIQCGLPRPLATQIVEQTIIGSMGVCQSGEASLSELVNEASTPGGISVESVFALEQRAFKKIVMDAIVKGTARADELERDSVEPEKET